MEKRSTLNFEENFGITSVQLRRKGAFENFKLLSKWVSNNKQRIIDILLPIAGLKSIDHEIEGSILALKGAENEVIMSNPGVVNSIGVFHSSNALLYEYVIHCIIPTAYSKKVIVRPSQKVLEPSINLHNVLMNNCSLPIELYVESQKEFSNRVKGSDVIIFSGSYRNAIEVMGFCNPSVFIFCGAGINPILIGYNQCDNNIVHSLVEARMLNAGQDCICSDIIFIPAKEKDLWISKLSEKLVLVKQNSVIFNVAEVSKIVYQDVLEENSITFAKSRKNIVFGGGINYKDSIIEPTIIYAEAKRLFAPREWFAPIFYLVGYDNELEVREWLLRPSVLKKAMYLSNYGFKQINEKVRSYYVILDRQTVLETEHPNKAFGGYGMEASFSAIKGQITSKPLLISEEIAYWSGAQEMSNQSVRES